METRECEKKINKWLNLSIIALVASYLAHELTLQNEHLPKENLVFKSIIKGVTPNEN